ncbi:MAG: endonuclease V [Intrasporangium sp.]|uniref:endonuclease V n=1 Tax=Intrasporangium sp. TaxID=1925024 RepID=UPI00264A248C|nr:endonuclease V [Intrasporangium sp.]MDN5796915.1 endonuclease V [Intrasporangium sp.]
MWPTDPEALSLVQEQLAARTPELWPLPVSGDRNGSDRNGGARSLTAQPATVSPGRVQLRDVRVGACRVCFRRGLTGPGAAGDPAWVASVVMHDDEVLDLRTFRSVAAAAYLPGLLALRIGRLMEDAVRSLDRAPDVLLIDATARDHPRRAGLALHLGAQLGLPTIGITRRPLVARGTWPDEPRGATSALRIGNEVVACRMRTGPGARPLVVHPGWRVDLETAIAVVLGTSTRHRTPEPLRQARRAAREARQAEESRDGDAHRPGPFW